MLGSGAQSAAADRIVSCHARCNTFPPWPLLSYDHHQSMTRHPEVLPGQVAGEHLRVTGQRVASLLQSRLGLAHTLDGGAMLLRFQPALARGLGRFCLPAHNWYDRRVLDQLDQALERVGAVALLGAMALRGDDQHAVAGEALAGKPLEPRAHPVGQARRAAHVEAQLHRGGELVDVLPAGPRGADKAFLELALVDLDSADPDHGPAHRLRRSSVVRYAATG